MSRFRPVKQQFHHDPANGSWGDCFRACLASLLGLLLSDVPHFMDKGVGSEVAGAASRAWLGARGLRLVEIPMTGDLGAVLATVENFNPGLMFMLSGHSRTGCDHCVICEGRRIIHDPSLTDAGIIGPCQGSEPPLYWISFLSPVEPQIIVPADLSEAQMADALLPFREELVRRNVLLRDDPSPAAKSRVLGRRYVLLALAQADERLRAGAATDLPATDLPAVDEPRVPRRPPLGDDPTRPVNGDRLPPGRYHP